MLCRPQSSSAAFEFQNELLSLSRSQWELGHKPATDFTMKGPISCREKGDTFRTVRKCRGRNWQCGERTRFARHTAAFSEPYIHGIPYLIGRFGEASNILVDVALLREAWYSEDGHKGVHIFIGGNQR